MKQKNTWADELDKYHHKGRTVIEFASTRTRKEWLIDSAGAILAFVFLLVIPGVITLLFEVLQ